MYGLIYKIINDENNLIYIGQTICSISKRWREHKEAAINVNKKNKLYSAMQEIGIDKFHILKLEEFNDITPEELDEKEIYWIAYYNSFYNGYNSTKGGKIGYRNLQPILCYTLSGKFYKEYNTIGEAAGNINYLFKINITYDMILICINNNLQESCGGFQWKYKNSNKEIKDFSTLSNFNHKKFYFVQYDLKGNYVAHFLNVKDASQQTNTQESGIIRCINQELKQSNNFIWRRVFFGDEILLHIEINGKISNKRKGIKKQVKYFKENKYITTFNSLSEASQKTGYGRTTITRYCQNYPKMTPKKEIFQYVNDEKEFFN